MTPTQPSADTPVPDNGGNWGSPVAFRVDTGSGMPIYLQIVHQVDHALRLGYLRQGDQLPRVRDVAGSLSINPNTVVKAYRELEHRGYATGRPGLGTFIVGTPRVLMSEKLSALRQGLVRGWLRDAVAAGLDQDEIVALFMAALRESVSGAGAASPDSRGAARRDSNGEEVA